MTPEQRLQATIALQPVDRIVCAPMIYSYAARFAGVTQARFINDFDLVLQCMDKLKAAYPVWDCNRSSFSGLGYGPTLRNRWFQKVALPGDELSEDEMYQVLEEELVSQEDVKAIKNSGPTKYMMKVTRKVRPNKGLIHYLLWEHRYKQLQRREKQSSLDRGQSFYYGGVLAIGFEMLSMTRSMSAFTHDMFRMGDELIEVLWILQKAGLDMAMKECRNSGTPRVFIVGCRCTPSFLNAKHFSKFSWPFLKDGALQLIAKGLTPVFHLDTDWGRSLEYFLELPKGKCIIETDGETDLFRAKEILKDHVCLAGDVPPALLTAGSASDTTAYCKKLIDVVGKGGGFLFSNGCTMPMNANHENVKAMFDAVERYGRYD